MEKRARRGGGAGRGKQEVSEDVVTTWGRGHVTTRGRSYLVTYHKICLVMIESCSILGMGVACHVMSHVDCDELCGIECVGML